jgi:hypothetical protein
MLVYKSHLAVLLMYLKPTRCVTVALLTTKGARESVVVKALYYNLEGCGFESR